MIKKIQKTQLILTLSVVTSAVILNGCGEDTTKTSEYYVSPLQTQSAKSDNVDLSSGILRKSDSDISSSKSLLSVARNYSSLTDENQSFGSWNLGYNSKVDKVLNYQHQKNASKLYDSQKEACEEGWDDIDESAFLGKLDGADAIYNSSNGLCDIYQDDEIVASMPTFNKTKKINPKIHTITRADGSTLAFIEKNAKWLSLTKEPYQFSVTVDGFELKNPDGTLETYDKKGMIKSLKSEAQTLFFGYNATKLTSITDSFGQTISFTYTNDVITEAKSFDDTKTLYEYDNNKNLIAVIYPDGSKSSYEYDQNGHLLNVKDNNGVIVASYIYDNESRVISTSKAKGSDKTDISYSDEESVVTKSSGESRYQFLVLNSLLKPQSLTTDEGVERYEYDSHGYLKQVVDKLGNITKTTFDENGLLVEQVSNVGSKEEKTTLTSYDTNLRKPLRVLENGVVNYYAYDKNGQLTSSIEAVVASFAKGLMEIKELRYDYNAVGQLSKSINEKGAISSFEYDKSGNQNKSTDELGFTSEVTKFDKAGRELEKVGINGEVSSSTYDTMGRMLSQTVNNQTTTYQYDGLGRAVKTTYPNGLIEEKSYDTVGNLLISWDNNGNKTQNSYDERNNLTKTEIFKNDTLISKTQNEYDTKDRVIASVDAFGKKTIFEYNQLGQKISQTDANANETRYEYDNLGRLTKEIDPMSGVTIYSFNKDGLQEKVTTPNSAIWSFGYNSLKQMTAKTSPDSGIVGLEYDISGNIIKETNAKGETKKYEYDIANRKTAVLYDDASLDERYEYDNGANAKGKLTRITDNTGSMSFEYDQNGNIKTKTQTIGNQTYSSHFSYDEDGKLLSQTLPSGKILAYTYDKNDLKSILIDGKAFISNITTDQNGIVGYDFGDGLKHSREYDLAGRVKKLSYPNYVENLSYDAVGNILAIDKQNFAYDALYRLTNYQNDGKIQVFGYDKNANRLSQISDENQTYNYKTGTNQLSKIEKIDKNSTKMTTDFLYDENGNLLKDALHEYIYDKKARLVGVDNNVSYAYNHENTRVSKIVNAQMTHFIYDGAKLIGEYHSDGSVKNEYLYLDNIPVGVIPRGYPQDGVKYIHTDHLGTPRRLADESGAILWSWESEPFGESKAVGNMEFNLRFAGQYYDAETSTHYNINRDYNPKTGRYLQSDPIGFDGGVNSYGYVAGNPLGAVDEMGLKPLGNNFWKVYLNYNDFTGNQVWMVVGGQLGTTYAGQNSCATRISYGLNYGGEPIKSGEIGSNMNYNGDGRRYIISAANLKKALFKRWGKADKVLITSNDLNTINSNVSSKNKTAIVVNSHHAYVLRKGYRDPYFGGYYQDAYVWMLP